MEPKILILGAGPTGLGAGYRLKELNYKNFDLYDALNEESLRGEGGPELGDRAVRRTLGIRLMKLERDLRRWIVTRAVVDPFAP